ncbi:MAG: beta-lactamase family protein [Betaproteobacteria bacterium]|nr:beta-lactamase family protein [Betaproteobacteria bacterium]
MIALLVGIALERGAIASLDDPAEKEVPAIKGSGYAPVSIRNLLRMGSGMPFNERYDGNDDIARMNAALYATRPGFAEFVRGQKARDYPPGEKFNYASIAAVLLGRVLEGATTRDVSALTSEWLWQPLGA